MYIIEKTKKELRMILAIINFISFFLPWLKLNTSINYRIMGENVGGSASSSITGFGIVNHSIAGIILYLIPIIIFLIPFIKQIKEIARYIYLVLPVVSLIFMFTIGAFFRDITGNADLKIFGASIHLNRQIGFWIALLCNIGIIIFTLIKDYNIRSVDDLKQHIENIDIDNLSAQVTTIAKDISSNVQKSLFVDCPKCGNKVAKGENFCTRCGTAIQAESTASVSDPEIESSQAESSQSESSDTE